MCPFTIGFPSVASLGSSVAVQAAVAGLAPRLDDHLHGIRLGMSGQIQRFHGVGQSKAVGDQPLKVYLTAAYKSDRLLLQVDGSAVRTQKSLLVHTNRGRVKDGLSSNRLGEQHDPAARPRSIYGGPDQTGPSHSQDYGISPPSFRPAAHRVDGIGARGI